MRVLFAAAELAPLARVGGLGEAAAGLIRRLRADWSDDLEIEVVLPDYGAAPLDDGGDGGVPEPIAVPEWAGPASARRAVVDGLGPVILVETAGIARPHPYTQPDGEGWPDNDHRFLSFSAAVAALATVRAVDVVHLNDWHCAAALAWIDQRLPSVLSIHNLQYQGQCSPAWLERLGVHADAFAHDGLTNPLAGGIRLAWRVVAVSPTYAREITDPAHGFGLHELLAAKREALLGIRNGINEAEWHPSGDPYVPVPYDRSAFRTAEPAAKRAARDALRRTVGLAAGAEAPQGPVIGAATRLVDQKGIDLIAGLAPFLRSVDAQLVVLGSGSAELAALLRDAAASEPERMRFIDRFDVGLAHLITAGSDVYLMPSRFEPCGLAQMQAMAYGTIPVTTRVGGLCDTVFDDDDLSAGLPVAPRPVAVSPESVPAGNGFSARTLDLAGLVDALHRAARAWRSPARRRRLIRSGMGTDWSWAVPAARHVELYRTLLAHAAQAPVTAPPDPDHGR